MAATVKNKHKWQRVTFICSTISILFFMWMFGAFVGIENTYRPGDIVFHPIDDMNASERGNAIIFLKRVPSSHVVYSNIVNPGETDLRPLEVFDKYTLNRFHEYCSVKYNMFDIYDCYQIFK